MGRIFIYIISFISLAWITYVGYDIINKDNQFDATKIFGKPDHAVLILQRLNEASISKCEFKTTPFNNTIIEKILPWLNKDNIIFISEKRNHILIESKENWSKNEIQKLFKNAKTTIEFTASKNFKSSTFKGVYNLNKIYIFDTKFKQINTNLNWNNFDEKSSSSIIYFNKSNFSIVDIYFDSKDITRFVSEPSKKYDAEPIDDESIFSLYIPEDIKSYHFFEKEYLAQLDPVFKASPMYSWTETGIVKFEYQDEIVYLSDYSEETNPIAFINDKIGSQDNLDESFGTFKSLQLSKELKGELHIGLIEGYAFISTSKNACENAVATYKIGHVLALNKKKCSKLYENLPQKTNERCVTQQEKFAKIHFDDKIFTTKINYKDLIADEEQEKHAYSFKMNEEIKDFIVYDNIGNFVTLTKDGKFILYHNNRKAKSINLFGNPNGKIQTSEINKEEFYLITTTKRVYLIDRNGSIKTEVKIEDPNRITNQASIIKNKNEHLIAFGTNTNEIQLYNLKAKKFKSIKSNLTSLDKPIIYWIKNKQTVIGTYDSYQYEAITIQQPKNRTKFQVNELNGHFSFNNHAYIVSLEKGKIKLINESNQTHFSRDLNNIELIDIQNKNSEFLLICKSGNTIIIINQANEVVKTIEIECANIESINVYKNYLEDIYLSIVDGINNNIYLYDNDNQLINNEQFEGQNQAKISWKKSDLIITTIIDDYIIQYQKK